MPPVHDLRAVLRIPAFRRLWFALSLSSLGDWLGLLATTALAVQLRHGTTKQAYALAGVLIVRLLPALLLGPLAGAFADRFDRRKTMVVCDVIRFSLFVSIPLVRSLAWLYAASFLVESVSLFWIPAKDASVPNLVPPARLESANQLSLLTTYGSAPVASFVFSGLAVVSSALGAGVTFFTTNSVDLALYFDAVTFLISAITIYSLREIGGAHSRDSSPTAVAAPALLRSIIEGWQFIGRTRMVRGLVAGILGAFAAGGAVIALARLFVVLLHGGNAAYGLLFAAIFIGLASGMFFGPRILRTLSRRRLFAISITGAGAALAVDAVLPDLVLALAVTVLVGTFAGIAWVTGYTLLGMQVSDEVRGRTFSFVQSLVRIDLLLTLAVAPLVAAAVGPHFIDVAGAHLRADGVTVTLFGAGILAIVLGVTSYFQMDDRRGIPLWRDMYDAIRAVRPGRPSYPGLFVAIEGGEGAGKSTQVQRLADWLGSTGREVVVTREPGATAMGARIRQVLLDRSTGTLSPRAEALLYAADRAEHVDTVIRPALERGAVVITDRYVDSSLAYQGGGRALPVDEVARLSRWATARLMPDLTVLLDVPPEVGLERRGETRDRIEAESIDFHERVGAQFRQLAARAPTRYAVIDGRLTADDVQVLIRERVAGLLPGAPDSPTRAIALEQTQVMSRPGNG